MNFEADRKIPPNFCCARFAGREDGGFLFFAQVCHNGSIVFLCSRRIIMYPHMFFI